MSIGEEKTGIALVWSILGSNLPQAINFIINIIIARLLMPSDYGLMAIALMVLYFLQIFLSHGLTTALIQYQTSDVNLFDAANFIFSINFIISIVLFMMLTATIPYIAGFFNSAESQPILLVMALSLVIWAFSDVQLALLKKNMQFKTILYRQLTPPICQILITLPLVIVGFRIWALVIGKLAADTLGALILWLKSEWKPNFNFAFRKYFSIVKFGFFVIITSFIGWIITQFDGILVGRYFNMTDLGLYRTGFSIVDRLLMMIVIPILPVYYAKSCRLTTVELKIKYYKKMKHFLTLTILPTITAIIMMSPFVETVFLGQKWHGISTAIIVFALCGIIHMWALISGFYKSIARPEIDTIMVLFVALIYTSIWLTTIHFGLKIFLIARVISALLAACVYLYYEKKVLKLSLYHLFGVYKNSILVSFLLVIVILIFHKLIFRGQYSLLILVAITIVSIITYAISLIIFDRSIYYELKILITDIMKRKAGNV